MSVQEFENIIERANRDGSFVRLPDVARVELGSQVYSAISKLNNKPAVSIAVYQPPGANALAVAEQIYAELDRMAERFPLAWSTKFCTTRHDTRGPASVQEVLGTLVITFLLVVAVTFLLLGDWRSTLVARLAMLAANRLVLKFSTLWKKMPRAAIETR